MSAILHQHRETSRRPIMAVVAVAAIAIIWFGLANSAPWYALLPIFAALAMALWMLAAGRISGCELTTETLRLFAGRWERRIALADVTSFSVTPWSEGPDWITLHIKGEADYQIPSHCAGDAKAMAAALDTRGISRT